GCNYNLRSQPLLGRCPECGRAAVVSALFSCLYHAPAAWVRRIAIGCATLAWCAAATLALVAAFSGFKPFAMGAATSLWAPFIGAAGVVTVLVLTLASVMLLTACDPTTAGYAEGVTARRVARTALLLFVGAAVVWAVLGPGGVIRDFFEILACA